MDSRHEPVRAAVDSVSLNGHVYLLYCLKSSVKQKLRYVAYYVSANMHHAFVVDTYISVMSYG